MSVNTTITCETADDCSRIRLSRGVTNTLTTELFRDLSSALDNAEKNTRGAMLCGGDKFFSNGVDVAWALTLSPGEVREMFLELGGCILKLLELTIPTVGAAKGHAMGGAFALLLACDYRYGATGHALFGKPEPLLGVPNPYFGDQLFRFVAGDFTASDLIYTGRLISAREAHDLQLLHGVADKEIIEAEGWKQLLVLRDLARNAFAESKRMRTEHLCARLREQMSARVARQVEIWHSPEAQERLQKAAKRLSR